MWLTWSIWQALVKKRQSLQALGVSLSGESNGDSEGRAHMQELTEESFAKHAKAAKKNPRTREELEADLKQKSDQLKEIKGALLSVQSKLRPRKERVVVDHEMLHSRTHELKRAQALVREVDGRSTQKLFSVYDEKLKALHEERKKADGLLAKVSCCVFSLFHSGERMALTDVWECV